MAKTPNEDFYRQNYGGLNSDEISMLTNRRNRGTDVISTDSYQLNSIGREGLSSTEFRIAESVDKTYTKRRPGESQWL